MALLFTLWCLILQLRGLKEKLGEDNTEINLSIEKVATLENSPNVVSEKCNSEFRPTFTNHEVYTNMPLSSETKRTIDFKEGLSDSDSSGVLNEDGNNLNVKPQTSKLSACPTFNGLDHSAFSLSGPVYRPHLLDSRAKDYQKQIVKMEEQSHFSNADESCNFFSVDQAPLFWYCSDPRNQ